MSNNYEKRRDLGDTPASEPGAVAQRSSDATGMSAAAASAGTDNSARREARRNKRAEIREMMGRPSVDAQNIQMTSGAAARSPAYDDNDDGEDDVDDETPGSFPVAGPATRRAQAEGKRPNDSDLEAYDNDDNKNLPVAFEAEVVVDYPNMAVVAHKDDGGRTVPLKWLIIGGCVMIIFAVAVSVGLGVALGGGNDRTGTTSNLDSDGSGGSNGAPTLPPGTDATGPPQVPAPTLGPGEILSPGETLSPDSNDTVAPEEPSSTLAPGETSPPGTDDTEAPGVPSITAAPGETVSPGNGETEAPEVPAPTLAPGNSLTAMPNPAPTLAPLPVAPVSQPTPAPVTEPIPAPVAEITPAPVTGPIPAPVAETTPAPVPEPIPAPVPEQTPVPDPTPVPDLTPEPVPAPETSGNFPLYSDGRGRDCQCRWYRQEFVVSNPSDWTSLSQRQISAIVELLQEIQEVSNPYPIGRLLRKEHSRRELIPTSYSYSLEIDSQDRFGNPSSGDFGVYIVYAFEFCVNDAPFLPEYHQAFVSHASRSSSLQQFADAVSISSLVRVTPPNELDRVCSG